MYFAMLIRTEVHANVSVWQRFIRNMGCEQDCVAALHTKHENEEDFVAEVRME
jgi:hypothetical protein